MTSMEPLDPTTRTDGAVAAKRAAARLSPLLRGAGRAALDLLLPPHCPACTARVADPGALCASCWGETAFIDGPVCASCGVPFAHAMPPGSLCAACVAAPPVFDTARAGALYEGPVRRLVLALKRADRWEAAPVLVALMARAGHELLAGADLLVPVPLHRWRLLDRRFNQAALLARGLSRASGVPHLPGALVRIRRTRSQLGLSPGARARNVAGAFLRAEKARDAVAGRRVCLIDDVLTTGATANACARVLMEGGAREVSVLTAARVTLDT